MSTKILSKGRYILQTPIRVIKNHPDAEPPFKEDSEGDAGWDITIVARCDNRAEDTFSDVNTFSTGLIITPPAHYHAEVVAHPSLWKAGYMLTNTIIINQDNKDELVLGLYKFREGDDLELPFRAGQLLLRLSEYSPIKLDAPRHRPVSRMPVFEDEDYTRPVSQKPGRTQAKKNHLF